MGCKIQTVNTTDIVGILDTQNYYHRQTSFGASWIEMRIGMLYTFVPAGNDDTYCTAESPMVTPSGPLQWFNFGLKDSSIILPGRAGSQFMGWCWPGTTSGSTITLTSNQSAAGLMEQGGTGGGTKRYIAAYNGATLLAGSADSTSLSFAKWSATTVNAIAGLKFVVNNAGLSNQTVTVSYMMNAGAAVDGSSYTLHTYIFGNYWTTGPTLTWNASSVALTLPDWVWMRLPSTANRLRITCLSAYKIS
jgi:hypothetical protein